MDARVKGDVRAVIARVEAMTREQAAIEYLLLNDDVLHWLIAEHVEILAEPDE